jgi:hypothetical protein
MNGHEGTFIQEVVSVVMQHPSNLLDPVVKDMFQFRSLALLERDKENPLVQ